MASSAIIVPNLRKNLVWCPVCEGKFTPINPLEQFMDIACYLCGGTKLVDLEQVCTCGRPVVWVYKGYMCCNSLSCFKEIDEMVEAIRKQKKERAARKREEGLHGVEVKTELQKKADEVKEEKLAEELRKRVEAEMIKDEDGREALANFYGMYYQ